MNTYRNLFLTALALLIVALAALVTILVRNPAQTEPTTSTIQPATGFAFISNELGFDATQQAAFTQLVDDYRAEIAPYYQQISNMQHAVADELNKQDPDTALISSRNDSMAMAYRQIREATTNHILKVKRICTPGQSLTLGKLYKNVVDETAKGRGKGFGNGRHQGRGLGRHRHRNGQ